MSTLPKSPWQELSVDFKEYTTGGYILVITDDYSRYPVVDIVQTLSLVIIPRLNKILAKFGVPEIVRSDNGPPFSGKDFQQFASTLGFKHSKVTPLCPCANGEVERFMWTINKTIKAAKVENRDWKEELCDLLRNYRATPHASTGKPPATILFNHPLRTKLPEAPVRQEDPAEIKQDNQSKEKMKKYADMKTYVKPSNITEGDKVLVRRDPSQKKSLTPYDPRPYVITQRKGNMMTAKLEEKGNNKFVFFQTS